jgi:hemoglobin
MKKSTPFLLACAFALLVTNSLAQTAPAGDDVFRGLGGKEGIAKIVDTLLPVLLADNRINDSFKDEDLVRLARLLKEQFCELAGGPCKYSGKDMKLIHDGLKITNAQFNALAEDLQTAMDSQGVSSRTQNKFMAKLATMQRAIVTK